MIVFITFVIEWILLFIVKELGILDIGDIIATLLIIISSIAFSASVHNNKTLSKYNNAILLGYLFRVFLLYFDLFGRAIYLLPNSGADTEMFYHQATSLILTGIPNRETNFALLLIRVFSLIGVNRLYGQYLLMMLSMAAIIVTIDTIDRLQISMGTKRFVSLLLNILPNFAILSSIFLRESLVTLFITISVCMLINWMMKGGLYRFVIAFISSIVACIYHSGSIGITIGCLLCLVIYDSINYRIHLTGNGLLIALLFALIGLFAFVQYGDTLMGKFVNVESIEDLANTRDVAGSSYARYVGNSNNLLNMIIFTLPRIVYFLFSPFPWQWRGISDIIAFFFSGLFYLAVIKEVIVFFRSKNKTNYEITLILVVLAFITTFIFAWGVSNTGTAVRHRDKMVCLFALIMAITRSSNSTNNEIGNGAELNKLGRLYLR